MPSRLWITYAWIDNEEGDFSYLVQELRSVGIDARYDRIELIPGQRLWEQIGDQIISGDLDGWAYLITPNSVNNQRCKEELGYALLRALDDRSEQFPLIGLVHQVPFSEIPPSLRIRLCVSLQSPTWKEEALAGIEHRPPNIIEQSVPEYVIYIYPNFHGDIDSKAIEVRPRFGQIMYWGFAVPSICTQPTNWGIGPADGGHLSGVNFDVLTGNGDIEGTAVKFYGTGSAISPSVSAYLVFRGDLPHRAWFGKSIGPSTPPRELVQLY